MSENDPVNELVRYVDLMLSGVEELPMLSHVEKFNVVRAMTVAGFLYEASKRLSSSDYHGKLRAGEKIFDAEAVKLAEKFEKYMRLRKLAGLE